MGGTIRAFGGQLETSRAKELRRELVAARGPRPRLFKDSMNKEGLGVTLTLLRIPVRDWPLLRDVTRGQH